MDDVYALICDEPANDFSLRKLVDQDHQYPESIFVDSSWQIPDKRSYKTVVPTVGEVNDSFPFIRQKAVYLGLGSRVNNEPAIEVSFAQSREVVERE